MGMCKFLKFSCLLLLFVHYTVDDSDSYVSEGEKEEEKKEKDEKEDDLPSGVAVTVKAPAQPTVPLGADFGMCE